MVNAFKMEHEKIDNTGESQNPNRLAQNAESLAREISWFAKVVNATLDAYFPKEKQEAVQKNYDLPVLAKEAQKPESENSGWFTRIIGSRSHSQQSEKTQVVV